MFQKEFKKATNNHSEKKYKNPKIILECVADLYTYYVIMHAIDPDTFWNSSIFFLDQIVADEIAYKNYINNPKEV